MMLLRTLLFVPGNRQRMIERARALAADVVILDLEDSVPPAEKEAARVLIHDTLPSMSAVGRLVYVRPNAIISPYLQQDLEAVVGPGLDGLCLPKVESAEEIKGLEGLLGRLEREHGLKEGTLGLIPCLESARGILGGHEIAMASPRVVGLGFGAEDFTADLGVPRSKEGTELFFARSSLVLSARAAEVLALDSVYSDYQDEEGLLREAGLGRQLGFGGKFLIHPNQIEPVNRVFSPAAEEVAYARRVVEAFEAAQAQGSAATSLEGRMIDTAVAARARKLLDFAAAIEAKEKPPD